MSDKCEHCGDDIYPDDEAVSVGFTFYHVECSELKEEQDQ